MAPTIELSIAERDREGNIVPGERHNVIFGRGEVAANFLARTVLRGLTGQERFNAELKLFGGND